MPPPAPPAVDLHAETFGDAGAPALLIVHGLFGSSTNWRTPAKFFARRFRVFALDLRCHGRSPWDDRLDYPAFAADIAHFARRQGLERPRMLAHSMGGKVAMYLVQTGMLALSQLVIADVAPIPYPQHAAPHLRLVDAMRGVDLTRHTSHHAVDAALVDAIPQLATRQFLLQNLQVSREGCRWRLHLDALAEHMDALMDYPADLGRAAVETLFIVGGKSDFVRPADEAAIDAAFSDWRLHRIVDAGHWLHSEKSAEFLEVTGGFLS